MECKFCGSQFSVSISVSKNRRFCSRACLQAWRNSEYHPRTGVKPMPRCLDCGKELGDQRAKYCTKHAGAGERGSNYKDGRTKRPRFCIDCGKRVQNLEALRCRDCFEEWNRGTNHYNWQDGKSNEPYPLAFRPSLKERIRERDGHKCMNCGITATEHQSKYGRKLGVHHIDYNKANLDEMNLLTLCQLCNTSANFGRDRWEAFYREKICESA